MQIPEILPIPGLTAPGLVMAKPLERSFKAGKGNKLQLKFLSNCAQFFNFCFRYAILEGFMLLG
jgi:hypothetical protein